MVGLEFIKSEIAITKNKYKTHLKFKQTNLAIEDEKRLKQLQQIKDELEAWIIIKHTFNILPRYDYNDPEIYILSKDGEKEISQYVRREEYDKINKALEIKNE